MALRLYLVFCSVRYTLLRVSAHLHQCYPDSIPGPGVICELISLLLALYG